MTVDEVLISKNREGVATVTLNRPEKGNALSMSMRDAVSDALDALAADEEVRCVVLDHAGDVFCAGFDLSEFRVQSEEFQTELRASSDRFHRALATFPLPLVASINGNAFAGGFVLAVMCDTRIASTSGRFAHPDRLRHLPRGWSQVVYGPLEALVGGAAARELCFMGRSVDATEALPLGLVSEVVEPQELAAETARLGASIARAPRTELVSSKREAGTPARIDPEVLISKTAEGVATITLNRPERHNALSIFMCDSVSDALDGLAGDGDVRCVVLTGSGSVFCAGFDVELLGSDRACASRNRLRSTVVDFPLPIVASVNGLALRAGFDLAVMCDTRIASTSARFAHPDRLRYRPETWTEFAYDPLEALVGGPIARELCFIGRSVDAAEALSIGLVSEVVEPEELAAETARLGASIARAPGSEIMKARASGGTRTPTSEDTGT